MPKYTIEVDTDKPGTFTVIYDEYLKTIDDLVSLHLSIESPESCPILVMKKFEE